MTARLEALPQIHAHCWQALTQAARQPGHAWRWLALATVAPAGAAGGLPRPDLRTVVLREADADARTLVFYTDSRSPKVAQLRAQAEAMLLAWDPTPGWQLRLRARLTVETDGLEVSSRWARLKMHPAAQDYLSPLPPGQPLAGPTPPDRGTRSHFAVVTAQVEGFDWLELHRDGHRRACFDAAGQGQWLSP